MPDVVRKSALVASADRGGDPAVGLAVPGSGEVPAWLADWIRPIRAAATSAANPTESALVVPSQLRDGELPAFGCATRIRLNPCTRSGWSGSRLWSAESASPLRG